MITRDRRVGRWFWKAETSRHRWSLRLHRLAPGNLWRVNRQTGFTEVMLARCVTLCHASLRKATWLIAPPGTRIGQPGWYPPPPGLVLRWSVTGDRPPYAVQRNGVLLSTGLLAPSWPGGEPLTPWPDDIRAEWRRPDDP